LGILANLQPVRGTDRRQTLRSGYGRLGTLRIADAAPSEVIVDNLSRDGCRIRTELPLTRNMPVAIGLAGVGIIAARVVWYGCDGYGCAFDNRLPAGSVTAAFSPTNIRPLELSPGQPTRSDVFVASPSPKWPVAHRALAVLLLSGVSWAVIGAVALFIAR
jgi:hypothetical protein